MDPGLILSAALIGLSFNNSFMCILLSVNATVNAGIKGGIAYLIGRFLGILCLGAFIALFGLYVNLNARFMLYLFGGIATCFGLILLLFPGIIIKTRLLRKCEGMTCDDCSDEKDNDCSGCPSSGSCTTSTEDQKHRKLSKLESRMSKFGIAGMLLIGALRGATPCVKIFILLPLLLTLPFLSSLTIAATYALSSMVYPLLGMSLASMLVSADNPKLRTVLMRLGAITMFGIGLYYIYKAWSYDCDGALI